MLTLLKCNLLLYIFTVGNLYAQNREYPIWFLYPKDNKVLITGIESSTKSPLENAALFLTAYSKSYVNGDLYFFQSKDGFKRQSEYFYEVSKLDYKKNLKKLIVYDCFINSLILNKKICAFVKSDTVNIEINYIDINRVTKPTWIDKNSYEENNYFYGIGEYTSTGDENEAWLTSEELAVFSLIEMYKIKLGTLIYYETDSKGTSLYEESTKYKLRHSIKEIEILERYSDFEKKMFYVLCRIEKKNLKALY